MLDDGPYRRHAEGLGGGWRLGTQNGRAEETRGRERQSLWCVKSLQTESSESWKRVVINIGRAGLDSCLEWAAKACQLAAGGQQNLDAASRWPYPRTSKA
jgi:hypothetical protein